jgi:hypothetical protein
MQYDGESRVIYVGADQQPRTGFWDRINRKESDSVWRSRVAAEMEDACREMTRRGHRLIQVVPILGTSNYKGSWTESAWLFFGPAEPDSR